MTEYDEFATPYTSGFLDAPNATNIVLREGCPRDFSEHLSVATSANTAQLVLNALDPVNAEPVTCYPVLPVVGGGPVRTEPRSAV